MDVIEGHPIPQDITGFQFKLIGDMTVKQFAYLAVGLVLGWIFISVPVNLIIKLPIALIPTLSGLFLAFVPIEGRPADTMLMLFVQAIFRPNEYVYHKPQEDQKKEMVQLKQQAALPNETPKKPIGQPFGPHITKVTSIEEAAVPAANSSSQNLSLSQAKKEEQVVEKNVSQLNEKLESAKKEEQMQQQSPRQEEAHQRSLELEQQLQQALLEKQALEKQLLAMQETGQTQTQPKPTSTLQQPMVRVKKVPDSLKKSVGMPFVPDVPNLITGIIRDSRGNVLPNVLVEVKDKEDNPVRAFKTNALGQFASATPLLNGTYTISFEDPKKLQKFDELEITTNGSILNPIEVVSIDEREQLRKSLFTQ